MNTVLAEMLGGLNTVLAICIVGVGAAAGSAWRPNDGGIIVGLLGGMVVATAICGVLATLIDIRHRLGKIIENTTPSEHGRPGGQR